MKLDRGSYVDEQWYVDVTAEGHARAGTLARAESPTEASGGLDWQEDVLPVLNAVYEAGGDAAVGPSQTDVNAVMGRESADPNTDRVMHELVRADYLEETLGSDQTLGPVNAKLTRGGLELVAGWPGSSGEAALDRLLAALQERIAATEDPDERTKLERMRDGVLGVSRDVAAGVLTAVLSEAARGGLT